MSVHFSRQFQRGLRDKKLNEVGTQKVELLAAGEAYKATPCPNGTAGLREPLTALDAQLSAYPTAVIFTPHSS